MAATSASVFRNLDCLSLFAYSKYNSAGTSNFIVFIFFQNLRFQILQPIITRAAEILRPIITGAAENLQPIITGAAEILRPIITGACINARAFLCVMHDDDQALPQTPPHI